MKKKDGGGGNVTEIDLGEKVSESIRQEVADQVRMAGGEKRGNVTSPRPVSRLSRFSGGYRPGMYGGYRPSWADRSSLSGGGWKLGEFLKLPEPIKSAGKDLLVGGWKSVV